jgi:hypothetical protein
MMRRLVVALVTLLAACTIGVSPAGAQTSSTSTASAGATTTVAPTVENDPLGRSLPRPNSGQKPQGFGDRGGAGQLIIFGLVTLFLAAIVLRIALATRKRTNSQKLP